MKKIIVLLLSVLVLMGCTNQNASETITITHKLGDTEITTNAKKVVIFDMGIVDIYDALGLEIVGLPKANLPTNLEKYADDKYTDVGTFFEPNFDVISALEPDLIIISGRTSKQFDALSEIAPTVYLGTDSSNDGTIASIHANLDTIKLMNPSADTDKLRVDLDNAVSDLHEKVAAANLKTTFILANGNEITTFTKGSRYDILFNEFGFTPAIEESTENNHGVKLSYEELYNINPDVMVVMDRSAVTGGEGNAKELLDNDFINKTKAATSDKIIYVNPSVWYLTEGGYNSTLEMINEVKVTLD